MSDLRTDVHLVATFELPVGSSIDLDTAADALVASQGGDVERATTTTWQGYDAIDVIMSDADGMRFLMRVILTPQRVYMVGVASYDDPVAQFATFAASFEITL